MMMIGDDDDDEDKKLPNPSVDHTILAVLSFVTYTGQMRAFCNCILRFFVKKRTHCDFMCISLSIDSDIHSQTVR